MRRPGVACAVLALVVLGAGCARAPAEVPPELLGRWTTAEPGFFGRAMTFTLDSVVFETGEEPPSRHLVVAVEEGPLGPSPPEIVVIYRGEGQREYHLALLHDTESRDLRLVNRSDVVWTKSGQ